MTQNITVVGVGALGSHLVPLLRNEDANLFVIDYDRVERKNTASQFHGVKTVGKSKVQGLQQTMKFMFGAQIKGSPHKLTTDNVDTLLSEADLIVDCLDNAKARQLVQNYVRQHQVPCLHGGLAADGTFGRILWDSRFQIDSEPSRGAATCQGGEFLPLISVVSSLMALSVQQFLQKDQQVSYQVTLSGAQKI